MLCHGVTRIAVDRAGQWVALMTMVSFKGSEAMTDKLTLEENDAAGQLQELIERRRAVCATLGQIRRQVA